jgi:hypothetical protein
MDVVSRTSALEKRRGGASLHRGNYERLRGPQFSAAWLDELAKWRQVLGLGRTDPLTGDVAQWAMIVLTAYFGGRSIEKAARILSRK